MSHFTVLVKVSKERLDNHGGNIESAVQEMLEPYWEYGGDTNYPRKYLAFHDRTDEVMKDAENIIEADSHMGKEHPESVGKTLLEHYGNLDLFAKEYHGYKKEDNKYGYWQNPNAKWDWYSIGGRWSGLLPVKAGAGRMGEKSWTNREQPDREGYADIVQVKDLDFDKMQEETVKEAEEFWQRYQHWLEIKDKPHKELEGDDRFLDFNMHETLYRMGIRKCVKPREPVLDENGKQVMEPDPFPLKGEEGRLRPKFTEPVFEDEPFTKEELLTKYRWHFEFGTYGVLDDKGWKAKGEMGWWGCSSDDVEDRQQWGQSFFQNFIANEDPETTLVVVDCHI